MELTYKLCLPRDEASVPLVRLLCRSTLRGLGVEDACVDDIELAVSEACSNVLKHADGDDEYEVVISASEETCTIKVQDKGAGSESPGSPDDWLTTVSEGGRGIHLMKALMDDLQFTSLSSGTVVTMTKTLALRPFSLLAAVSQAGQPDGRT